MSVGNRDKMLPFGSYGAGLMTHFGTLLPPTVNVAAYVHSGLPDHLPREVKSKLVPTLSSALARCKADRGDVVYVLPGHSETTAAATMLDNLVDGTRVIGIGRGSNQPVFQLTDTAAQWAIDDNDCVFENLHLKLEGANGITKAINVTGSDNAIVGCRIKVGTDASNHAAIALEVGSGADRFALVGCDIYGAIAGGVTNGVLVAATVDEAYIGYNRMDFATTSNTVGCINVTAAATGLTIEHNRIRMSKAGGTAAITLGNVACSGDVQDNRLFAMGADATPASTIIVLGAANTMRFAENYGCSEDDLSAILVPAAT